MRNPISISVLLLIVGNSITAVIAAGALDVLIIRPPEPAASITTLLPGLAYACATVMKVCLVAGILAVALTIVKWSIGRLNGTISNRQRNRYATWGIWSIILAPAATLIGAFVAIGYQRVLTDTAAVTTTQLQHAAQNAVFAMLATLSAGFLAGIISLVRREGAFEIPMFGLAVNIVLIGLFLSLKFYVIGFDQDRWAGSEIHPTPMAERLQPRVVKDNLNE